MQGELGALEGVKGGLQGAEARRDVQRRKGREGRRVRALLCHNKGSHRQKEVGLEMCNAREGEGNRLGWEPTPASVILCIYLR